MSSAVPWRSDDTGGLWKSETSRYGIANPFRKWLISYPMLDGSEYPYNGPDGPGADKIVCDPGCRYCCGRGWYVVHQGTSVETGQKYLTVLACRSCEDLPSDREAFAAALDAGVLCSPDFPHLVEPDDLMEPWGSRFREEVI